RCHSCSLFPSAFSFGDRLSDGEFNSNLANIEMKSATTLIALAVILSCFFSTQATSQPRQPDIHSADRTATGTHPSRGLRELALAGAIGPWATCRSSKPLIWSENCAPKRPLRRENLPPRDTTSSPLARLDARLSPLRRTLP